MTANKIQIKYTPRNWADALHTAVVRWIVLVLHRRAGKSTAAINHLIRDAMQYENTRYAYIAPTFKQAKRIIWGMVKEYTRDIKGVVYNESELSVRFANGSELLVLGSDNPDTLRGIALWGAFLDEYPQQSPIVFTQIVTKCLADHLGYCIFGGTPKGKGHFFKVFQIAQTDPAWCLIYKTIDNSIKEEEGETINNLKQALADDRELVKQGLMTQEEFDQEWYNSFEAAIKGAVYRKEIALAREEKRITAGVPWEPNALVHTVWDLGIGDAMSIGFYQRVGKELHKIDYYENTGLGMAHYIKIVKEKPYVYGKHFAPHDIKQKELMSGKSRIDTAESMGIKFEVVPSVSIASGIDKARAIWSSLWVDAKKCELWIDLIGMYHYEEDPIRGILKREPEHDFSSHAADEFRYAAIVADKMVNELMDEAPTPKIESVPDEYTGTVDPTSSGRHPMLEGVDIGKMGHT